MGNWCEHNDDEQVFAKQEGFTDVIVDDGEDRSFMLVDVKASIDSAETLQEFVDHLNRSDASVSFGMLVDLENIHLLKRDSTQGTVANLVKHKTRLETNFGTKPVQDALQAAGIGKYVVETNQFLGWYRSQPSF